MPGSGGEAGWLGRRGGEVREGRWGGACRPLRAESPGPPSGVAGSFWQQRGVSGREATAGVQERGRELCSGRAWKPWGGVVSLVRGPTALPCSAAEPHKQRGRPRFLRSSGRNGVPVLPTSSRPRSRSSPLVPAPPGTPCILTALISGRSQPAYRPREALGLIFFFLSSWLQCVPDSSRSFCSAASNCLGGVRLGPPRHSTTSAGFAVIWGLVSDRH